MIEKWERQPLRVGMVAGFISLPILWILQGYLLHLAFGSRSPSSELLLRYFVMGAIPGAILGAGVSKAALARRHGDGGAAKWHLVRHGGAVFTLFLLLHAPYIWRASQNTSLKTFLFGFPVPPWFGVLAAAMLSNLPFQCALLMLFVGLLMRSRR